MVSAYLKLLAREMFLPDFFKEDFQHRLQIYAFSKTDGYFSNQRYIWPCRQPNICGCGGEAYTRRSVTLFRFS